MTASSFLEQDDGPKSDRAHGGRARLAEVKGKHDTFAVNDCHRQMGETFGLFKYDKPMKDHGVSEQDGLQQDLPDVSSWARNSNAS